MINLIIAYDDNDSDLGEYFDESFNSLSNFISLDQGLTLLPLNGLDCSESNVITLIESFEEIKFIFVGLSHGNDEQLLTENEIIVDKNDIGHFENSLFYTPACNTANVLGKELIDSNCFSFVGCNQVTYSTFEEFNQIYYDCENYCLKDFLESGRTISESFQKMLDFFEDTIVDFLDKNDEEILVAMELIHNKDSFVLCGNKKLTRVDLE